ncbi:anti-sigma factor [Terriglobus saanensis]|uniref:Anti-sigma K factor RskA n=1 Tax=Terriglobus saanensis (strain ATCC BAA-1853 / DSM 23119 / SP1PR4) TaxID=401053 RepID=E8UZN2_TERSS|nr:anti-sigma factor [Terriglobus saanensis]ADV84375.1 Anti-sigma K factor RskA [Terriglobus saanensis SP1PR4]
MSSSTPYRYDCSEKYAELCAISTTGELSTEELADLNAHLAGCSQCAELLEEYTSLAHIGMAKLAPESESSGENLGSAREKAGEQRLIKAIHAMQPASLPDGASGISSRHWTGSSFAAFLTAVAAVLLICVGGAFEVGRKSAITPPRSIPIAAALPPIAIQNAEEVVLREKLSTAEKTLNEITSRSAQAEKQITDLSRLKTSLLAQVDDLSKKNESASTSLLATTQQRDELQQQLGDVSKSLERVRQDLDQARQDRQGALLRVASLENDVSRLNGTLAVTNKAASNSEQFLAQDRDVRELMGARQLYIADVFDVQQDGQRSKPFGRVFYTKGKSLMFYAFDLSSQPGYHEANAFQAWGKPDSNSSKPISLGIFYLDSQSNRRWVLKSDNPDVLAQINAVFVTVEPKGGSAKPTGKPFLEAYLHTLAPNHP